MLDSTIVPGGTSNDVPATTGFCHPPEQSGSGNGTMQGTVGKNHPPSGMSLVLQLSLINTDVKVKADSTHPSTPMLSGDSITATQQSLSQSTHFHHT